MRRLSQFMAAVLIVSTIAVGHAQSLQVTPLAKDGHLLVTLRMNDVFTDEVKEAMHSGLRITFSYDVELKRSTALWVDRTIAATRVSATIEYDILTRRYLATRHEDGRFDKAETLDREEAARVWLTEFEKLPLFKTSTLELNEQYYLRVRAHTTPGTASFVWPWQGGINGLAKFTYLR